MKTFATPGILKQGLHPDPLDPRVPAPDRRTWPARQPPASASAEMHAFRAALTLDGAHDVRASVIDDLCAYYNLTPEQCVQRCIGWEQWSIEEWQACSGELPDALRRFYQTTQSWSFDLLWYAYLQAEGYAYPVSVAIARTVPRPGTGLRHLDFGSGIGATSQLFARLGYETDLADVSPTLLSFARFRLERRSESARFIDLNTTALEPGRYDVITAIDTLVHVPDVPVAARTLHQALRPGGLLFANFDVRPKTAENALHLYDNDLPLRWALQRAGFEPEVSLDGMITRYRKVDTTGAAHRLRGVRDTVLLRSPLRPTYRMARVALRRPLTRLRRSES